MSFLSSSPQMPAVPNAPAPPPTFSSAQVQAAGNMEKMKSKGGFGSTILTGGMGLLDLPSLGKKSLLGG